MHSHHVPILKFSPNFLSAPKKICCCPNCISFWDTTVLQFTLCFSFVVNACSFIYRKKLIAIMSQNCKSTYTTATTRDANNNTLYHGGTGQGYGGRGYAPPSVASNGNYKQMTAKVLFGGVTTINDLKRQDKAGEVRRTH